MADWSLTVSIGAEGTSQFFLLPQEVLLHIMSFLDLPELDNLAAVSRHLSMLCKDPILHQNRLRVVVPSRIEHSLFARGGHGALLRPSVPDLVRMNVMRGLGIERRWRLGNYLYSAQSVKHYESSLRLEHAHVIKVLTIHFSKRADTYLSSSFAAKGVLQPSETISPLVSRRLLPVIARLKWSMARDRVSRRVRAGPPSKGLINDSNNFKVWLEGNGRSVVQEGERVRLAICPSVKKIAKLFENIAASSQT